MLYKRRSMNAIAGERIANSSKDVSNGGIFGTILQLITYSSVGADININKIKIPPILIESNYDLEMYSKMYLTTSFILTAHKSFCKKIIDIFGKDLQSFKRYKASLHEFVEFLEIT